jgi:hypothetical protein
MIEKEYITPFDSTADKARTGRKSPLSKIGFVFALLGLATPFLVFLVARLGLRLPCCGEGGNPGDGIGWMLVMIGGIAWWTVVELISVTFTALGLFMKEKGQVKIFAVAASGLSLILIVSVYVGALMLVRHVSNETKRYESSRNI